MTDPQVIVISGASGLVGSALTASLQANQHLVRALVRRAVQDDEHEIRWQPGKDLTDLGEIDADELNGVDAVVHLAGENIAGGRWTPEFKNRVVNSRVVGTRLLCETLASLPAKPKVLVSASAIGFYGDRDQPVDEQSLPGDNFLAETCVRWEAETKAAVDAGIRVVNLRIGIVLSPDGGALGKLLTPFKLGLGGIMGDGRQPMSWIALPDLVRAIEFAINTPSLAGPVNAVAPGWVSNRQFTKALGRVLGRPTLIPAPAFALRLALGEMADEMLLGGAPVEPNQLTQAGFEFQADEIEAALRLVLK